MSRLSLILVVPLQLGEWIKIGTVPKSLCGHELLLPSPCGARQMSSSRAPTGSEGQRPHAGGLPDLPPRVEVAAEWLRPHPERSTGTSGAMVSLHIRVGRWLCMANCQIWAFLGFREVAWWCHTRTGRPVSASAGDDRPTRRAGRRACRGRRIRARQAPMLIFNGSRKRSPNLRLSHRMVADWCALVLRPRRDSFGDRPQTLNAVEPSSSDTAEISAAVLVERCDEASIEGT